MRAVTIPVYASKKLDLFVERLKDGFELWAVGIVKGQRVLIDHHLTRDDWETKLEYAGPEDLIWRDAAHSEIPAQKHKLAIGGEETIGRRVFGGGVRDDLAAIDFLDKDKKDTAAAKKAILGRWTDGVVTFSLEPNNKLRWTCADLRHWLNVWGITDKQTPSWWDFSSIWELYLMADMDTPQACGTHVGVLHVDENEVHLRGGVNRIAHVFRRVKDNESVQIRTANRGEVALK